jgi:hypothetical protein
MQSSRRASVFLCGLTGEGVIVVHRDVLLHLPADWEERAEADGVDIESVCEAPRSG